MSWRSINFDWNRARAFLVTAEEGSLSAAARALGMTQPTLGRQVSSLESELGVALFERIDARDPKFDEAESFLTGIGSTHVETVTEVK